MANVTVLGRVRPGLAQALDAGKSYEPLDRVTLDGLGVFECVQAASAGEGPEQAPEKWICVDAGITPAQVTELVASVEQVEAGLAAKQDAATASTDKTVLEAALALKADKTSLPAQMTGATASAAGKGGLVPAPAAGAQGKYLRGDGSWQTPPNTTYTAASAAPKAAGTAAVGTSAKYAREDHVHPAQTTVSGNAGTATKLATARNLQVNLASTTAASFDGSANKDIGVKGALPVANGGTGKTTAAEACAALGAVRKAGDTMTGQLNLVAPTDNGKASKQAAPVSFVRDMLRAEVEAASSGRNTVVRDTKDNPHVMVVIPAFNLQDIDASLGTGLHPAFIVNGVRKAEILVGKYCASKGAGDWALTQPGKFPWVNIDFDTALAKCRALGTGFGLASRAIMAARALWLWKEFGEHEYLGNTNSGRSHSRHWQTGVMEHADYAPGDSAAWNAGKNNYVKAGSGPVDWMDDGTPFGMADLTGNVWEWEAGLRVNNGEIQIIENNNALMNNCDMGANSSQWKAILANGSLAAPGTANTLKYDASVAQTKTSGTEGAPRLNTTLANKSKGANQFGAFKDTTAASGLTAPGLVKALGLYPIANNVQGSFWSHQSGEILPLVAGAWNDGNNCGPFALSLKYNRTFSTRNVGFRPAYYA